MRLTFFTVLFALVLASASAAAPPPTKGKPATTGAGCKPSIAVVLKGTLTAPGTAVSLSVNVTGGNKFAAAFKGHTTAVTLTPTTKINRAGDHTATHLLSGDRVNIQAKACKAAIGSALTATRVTAHAANG